MTYAFQCQCGQTLTVDAENGEDALNELMTVGGEHMKTVHPDAPPMSDDAMRDMLKAGMKKEGM